MLVTNIENLPEGEMVARQRGTERALLQMRITFNVYGARAGVEKNSPFDLVPRIVPATEWSRIGNSSQAGRSKDPWVLADAPLVEKDEFASPSPATLTTAVA
jgi:uncharacterized circularly permuted ATP-grasp superfamily protein